MRRFSLFITACLFTFSLLPGATDPESELAVGEEVEDTGTFLETRNDLMLQLVLKDKYVVATFVDAGNKIVENPAESILFIVDDTSHRDDNWRTVLKPDGDLQLISPLRFYGPPDFRAKIIVRYKEGKPETFARTPLELKRNM